MVLEAIEEAEGHADELLSGIADRVNFQAAASPGGGLRFSRR
jgi:hypothetical protein